MATLVLTAVGSAIAGPIGAAIGAMAGQRVDQMLFAPKARSGARLANLAVQTSSYGTSLPKVFGRMRVSGAVIWATDLREERKTVSQGKGRPKATVYSYSASFAVALSARAAVRVGRIWADGKLLRGEAGDFKVETGFRFHGGHEDQMPDPLIASAEGIGQTPAYRGLAYAVFEDMALESFGNRIPMLSFELIADDGEVRAGEIIAELAGKVVGVDCPSRVLGYVADGASVRAAIAPLVDLVSARAWHGGAALRVAESAGSTRPCRDKALVWRLGRGKAPRNCGGRGRRGAVRCRALNWAMPMSRGISSRGCSGQTVLQGTARSCSMFQRRWRQSAHMALPGNCSAGTWQRQKRSKSACLGVILICWRAERCRLRGCRRSGASTRSAGRRCTSR